MDAADRIKICKTCTNRKFDFEKGLICGLNSEKPTFGDSCKDYTADLSAIEDKGKPKNNISGKSWAYLTVSVLLLMVLVIAFQRYQSYAENEAYASKLKSFPDKYFLDLSAEIEKEVKNLNPSHLRGLIDFEVMTNKFLDHLYLKRSAKEYVRKEFKEYITPGRNAVNCSYMNGDFSFLKFYRENNVPHLIFRSFQDDFFQYSDYEFGINSKGEMKIVDIYEYHLGADISEYYFEMLELEVGLMAGTDEIKELSVQQLSPKIDQLYEYMDKEYYDGAYDLFNELPEKFKNKKSSQYVRLQIALNLEDSIYNEVLTDYLKLFPNSARLVAFQKMLTCSLDEPSSAAQTNSELEKHTGKDEILKLLLINSPLIEPFGSSTLPD